MNQWTTGVFLMKKTSGQKSCETVPLRVLYITSKIMTINKKTACTLSSCLWLVSGLTEIINFFVLNLWTDAKSQDAKPRVKHGVHPIFYITNAGVEPPGKPGVLRPEMWAQVTIQYMHCSGKSVRAHNFRRSNAIPIGVGGTDWPIRIRRLPSHMALTWHSGTEVVASKGQNSNLWRAPILPSDEKLAQYDKTYSMIWSNSAND
jgi:hypothetical protein